MAKPRAAQFAKDIGVSTNQAKKLINEGRRRKDGGSNILEATMTDTSNPNVMADKEERKRRRLESIIEAGGPDKTAGSSDVGEIYDKASYAKAKAKAEKMLAKMTPSERSKGGLEVRGMGRAYMGNSRKVQIR